MTMHRDTDFTFEDILDGAHLGEAVKEYSAIVSTPNTSETLKNLRFIRIPPDYQECIESDLVFEIVESGDYPQGADYIAVSYCWNSFARENENQRIVSVLDHGIVRKPRCSTQVLLRAASFAAPTTASLVWIDQECIDQTDYNDVRKHLQCMHHIYRDAQAYIGLLNYEIFQGRHVLALAYLSRINLLTDEVWASAKGRPEYLTNADKIELLTRLLTSIHKDPWFSRTWVLQERFSGFSSMHLLFKMSPKLRDELQTNKKLQSKLSDPSLLLMDLRYNPSIWLLKLRKFRLETPRLRIALENLHIAAMRLNATFQGFTIDAAMDFITKGGKIAKRDYPMDGYYSKAILHSIEACDNQVVSDRVAIFSNIADLPHRLETLGLSSYSMSLLMLLSANEYLPRILFTADMDGYNSYHPLVHSPLTCDLHTWMNKLCGLLSDESGIVLEDHPLFKDCKAVMQTLVRHNPEIWSHDENWDQNLKVELENSATGPLKCTVVIPMSATIQDVIGGIIRVNNKKRENLTHRHGRHILRYAIATGQAPKDAKFVAFYGIFCWRAEFVEKFFCINDGSRGEAESDNATTDEAENGEVENGEVENGEVENGEVENGEVENDELENDEVENEGAEDEEAKSGEAKSKKGKSTKAKSKKVKHKKIKRQRGKKEGSKK